MPEAGTVASWSSAGLARRLRRARLRRQALQPGGRDEEYRLRAGWAAVGVERLRAGAPGLLSYNLSAVSQADLQRLEQRQRAYYREMVGIIADSAPAQCVVLYAAPLLELR